LADTKRWRANWLVVSPPGAVRVDLRRWRANHQDAMRAVGDLPAGTPVVLSAVAPGAIGRCRSFAAETGIEVEGEYLADPTASAAAFLVEDAPATVRVFVKTLRDAPPRGFFTPLIEAAVVLLRTLSPWRLIRAVAPGRVVVGRRL
jgi:hypothetical protein